MGISTCYSFAGVFLSTFGSERETVTPADGILHTALKKAGINGPYVLVGHSLGALVSRLYAGDYPDEVAGMVFVRSLSIPPGGVGTDAPGVADGGGGKLQQIILPFAHVSPRDHV